MIKFLLSWILSHVLKIVFRKTCAWQKKSIYVENLQNQSRESSENQRLCFVFLILWVFLGVWPTRKFPTLKGDDPARTLDDWIDYSLVHRGKQWKGSGKSFCSARSNSFEGKQRATSKLKLEEILELSTRGYMEGTSLAYELIGGLIKRLINWRINQTFD